MSDLARLVGTPLSPVLVSITNHAPAVRPSGATDLAPIPNPWQNPDGSPSVSAYVWTGVSVASGFASAYHGAKRHHGSVGWGLVWGLMGTVFPVVTPAIAMAQGFAKPMGR